MTTLTLALVGSNVVVLGIAALAIEIQDRAMRRRLRPADRTKVERFIASRRAAA